MTEAKTKGITYAEAEYIADKELLAKIRYAEKTAGITTGVRHSTGKEGAFLTHRVSVIFYPRTKFFIEDKEGDKFVNHRPLTDDEYEITQGLKL